jgi:hypothetical protein
MILEPVLRAPENEKFSYKDMYPISGLTQCVHTKGCTNCWDTERKSDAGVC